VRALVLVANAVTGAPESTEPDPPHVQAVVTSTSGCEQGGDAVALNEIECRVWLDGPEAAAGRGAGAAAAELFRSMNGIALAAPPTGDAIQAPSAWKRLEEIRVPTLVDLGVARLSASAPAIDRTHAAHSGGELVRHERCVRICQGWKRRKCSIRRCARSSTHSVRAEVSMTSMRLRRIV